MQGPDKGSFQKAVGACSMDCKEPQLHKSLQVYMEAGGSAPALTKSPVLKEFPILCETGPVTSLPLIKRLLKKL